MNYISGKIIIYCLAMCILCTFPSCSSSSENNVIVRKKPSKMSNWKKVACTVRLRHEGCYDYFEGEVN